MMGLPSDCLRHILEYLSIQDSVNACLALSNSKDALQLIRDRKSPIRLFSRLVPDAYDLLYYMSVHNCVLSGSRAVDYIYPGSCESTSNWNFYIDTVVVQQPDVFGSMKEAFETMGVVWSPSNPYAYSYGDMELHTIQGRMEKGRGKGQIVQLSASNRAIIDTILSFCYTVTQCIVTHYGAVHLYGKLSNKHKYIVWDKRARHYSRLILSYNRRECCKYILISQLHGSVMDSEMEEKMMRIVKNLYIDYLAESGKSLDDPSHTSESLTDYIHSRVDSNVSMGQVRVYILLNIATCVDIARLKCVCIHRNWLTQQDKYKERGYQYITPGDYSWEVDRWHHESTPERWRQRYATDNETTVVLFKGYGLSCPDSIIEEHIRTLSTIEWRETRVIATRHYDDIEV